MIRVVFAFFLVCSFSLVGCAAKGSTDKADSSQSGIVVPPPKNSKLARVKIGMEEFKVRKIMGEPDDTSGHISGKAFIPFYFGSDVARYTWRYQGIGRIVFSHNRYNGEKKVVQLKYDPKELK